jgi:ADP-ribose pyrophosphatase
LDEEHEDIKVHVFEREAALAMLEAGKINNAITLIGLQWLALHHKELQQRWLGA